MRLETRRRFLGGDVFEILCEVEALDDCHGVGRVGPGRQRQAFVSMQPLYDVQCTWHRYERRVDQLLEAVGLAAADLIRVKIGVADVGELVDTESAPDPEFGVFRFADRHAEAAQGILVRFAVQRFGIGQQAVEIKDHGGNHATFPPRGNRTDPSRNCRVRRSAAGRPC